MSALNTYLSALTVTDVDDIQANITMYPAFNVDVSNYFFNVSSDVSSPQDPINLSLDSGKFNPLATWEIDQYVLYACQYGMPGYSPLGPNDTLPFANSLPFSISSETMLSMVIRVSAPATSAQAPPYRLYTIDIAHNCPISFN